MFFVSNSFIFVNMKRFGKYLAFSRYSINAFSRYLIGTVNIEERLPPVEQVVWTLY